MDESLQISVPAEKMEIPGRTGVFLRLARLGDEQAMYDFVKGDEEHASEFKYWEEGSSVEAARAEVERSVTEIEKGTMMRYRIVNADDAIVGEVSMFKHDPVARTAEFGYAITAEYEGQGIVSAASRRLLEYAFDRWNLERVILTIQEGNTRSENLAQALGARLTEEVVHHGEGDKARVLRVWEIIHE